MSYEPAVIENWIYDTLKADATPTASAEELSKHLKPGDRVFDPHFCHYYDLRRLGLVPLGLPLPEQSVQEMKLTAFIQPLGDVRDAKALLGPEAQSIALSDQHVLWLAKTGPTQAR